MKNYDEAKGNYVERLLGEIFGCLIPILSITVTDREILRVQKEIGLILRRETLMIETKKASERSEKDQYNKLDNMAEE